MIVVTIPGELRGKGRPRFARRGRFVQTYTDDATQNAEAWVRSCGAKAMAGALLDGPLSITLDIGVPVPASWSAKKRAAALAGATFPTGKPDLDNQLKLVGDALNGVVWRDDKQIVRAVVTRRYVADPVATLTVSEA